MKKRIRRKPKTKKPGSKGKIEIERNPIGVKKYSQWLERCGWTQIFLACLSQTAGTVSFPAYNVVLSLWTCYCAYNLELKPLFLCIFFTILSISLDVIFCSIWGIGDINIFDPVSGEGAVKFCLIMLILNMAVKVLSAGAATLLYMALGGHFNLQQSESAARLRHHRPQAEKEQSQDRLLADAGLKGAGSGSARRQAPPRPLNPGTSGIGELTNLG